MSRILSSILVLCIVLALPACRSGKEDRLSWAVSLDHDVKAPYGSSIAWKSLPFYFPGARIEPISRNFRYSNFEQDMLYAGDSSRLFVMLGLSYYVSQEEWDQLRALARGGNELLIISNTLDNKLARHLGAYLRGGAEETPLSKYNPGDENVNALSLAADSNRHYGHKGRSLTGYFRLPALDTEATTALDSMTDNISELPLDNDTALPIASNVVPEVLGYSQGHANFVRFRVGRGHITLHAAPLAFSNYFLLQPANRAYLDGIWHSFPANISHIYWNEYYKRSTEGSNMGVLWRYPATRWALITAIGVLIIYVLIGVKRRQRMIPVIKSPENASVSFAETIARLYYNKGNHRNLAGKMIQHFLEWVRSYYYLDTSMLNDDFIRQLSAKSGKGEDSVRSLVQLIHDIRTNSVPVDANYLHLLHRSIQSFYENNKL